MENFIKKLSSIGSVDFLENLLFSKNKKGVSPEYDDKGSVPLVNSQHLGKYGLYHNIGGECDKYNKDKVDGH